MAVAVHEAGHCALSVLMGRRILFVTVEPVGDTLGRTVFAERTVLDLCRPVWPSPRVAMYVNKAPSADALGREG